MRAVVTCTGNEPRWLGILFPMFVLSIFVYIVRYGTDLHFSIARYVIWSYPLCDVCSYGFLMWDLMHMHCSRDSIAAKHILHWAVTG